MSPLCCSLLVVGLAAWHPEIVLDAQGARFRVQQLAVDLQQPSAMVFLPDGRGLLVERRSARIDIVDLTSGSLTPLDGGFVAVMGRDSGAHDPRRPAALAYEDAGLHDIALHPDYAHNGWIYVSYSSGDFERSTTALDRFRLRGDRIVDRERIFTPDAYSEDRFHYGGRLAFVGPYLFMTIGDRLTRTGRNRCRAMPARSSVSTTTAGFPRTTPSSARRTRCPKSGPLGTATRKGSSYIQKRASSGSTNTDRSGATS